MNVLLVKAVLFTSLTTGISTLHAEESLRLKLPGGASSEVSWNDSVWQDATGSEKPFTPGSAAVFLSDAFANEVRVIVSGQVDVHSLSKEATINRLSLTGETPKAKLIVLDGLVESAIAEKTKWPEGVGMSIVCASEFPKGLRKTGKAQLGFNAQAALITGTLEVTEGRVTDIGHRIKGEPLLLLAQGASFCASGNGEVFFSGLEGDGVVSNHYTDPAMESTLSITGDGKHMFSGVLADGRQSRLGFALKGTGTQTLGGSEPNTHTGATTLESGELVLAKTGAVAISGPLRLQGGTLTLAAPAQIAESGTIAINGKEVLLKIAAENVSEAFACAESNGGKLTIDFQSHPAVLLIRNAGKLAGVTIDTKSAGGKSRLFLDSDPRQIAEFKVNGKLASTIPVVTQPVTVDGFSGQGFEVPLH